MNIEILFRGKRKDNQEWVYGSHVAAPALPFSDRNDFIVVFVGIESGEPIFDWYEVIPETVGQYTGLKDKNGEEIYEGDILSAERTVNGIPWPDGKATEVFGNIPRETRTWKEILIVEFKITENSISFVIPKEGETYQERGKKLEWGVIGNIHNNQEILNK